MILSGVALSVLLASQGKAEPPSLQIIPPIQKLLRDRRTAASPSCSIPLLEMHPDTSRDYSIRNFPLKPPRRERSLQNFDPGFKTPPAPVCRNWNKR